MEQLEAINKKLSEIEKAVNSIDKNLALEIAERKHINDRIEEVEKTSNQYKADRYKVIGASGIISSLIAWFTK